MKILIRNGHVIDPKNGVNEIRDLQIADERIVSDTEFNPDQVIDANQQIVCPGFIDLCARLREPGLETKATIASETRAAAGAGITTLICPPDTDPVIDEPAVVGLIRRRAEASGHSRVLPVGALTRGLGGEDLAELAALKAAGCVAVGNASRPVQNSLVMRRSLEYAASHGLTVLLNPNDPWLSAGGCAHDGQVATRLGLPGIPVAAEVATLARDLALIEDIDVRVHFGRLSSAHAVDMIAAAREAGLQVSADVSAHQLHLTETDISGFNSECHVLPPLRSERDKNRLRSGLADGTLTAVCSDHQPHDAAAKLDPFPDTEPGISGLETLLALMLKLVDEKAINLPTAIAALTSGPADILGMDRGHLGSGAWADVCVFDLNATWELSADTMRSRGHNSPFLDWEFSGQVTRTLLEGRTIFG